MKLINRQTAPKPAAPERIIQFGDGNFLRAFTDWIVQKLNDSTNFNSSVVVLQCTRGGKRLPVLEAQDCMYHVNLQGKSNGEIINSIARINCISRGINPYTQFDAYISLADQPEIRFVVSNTTEAGICFDPACRLTDTPCENFPARLTQLLYRRFVSFNGASDKGLIILPCELIFDNGKHLKDSILGYIDLWKEDLGNHYKDFKQWFIDHNYVCSTLVDRIVPGFPHQEIDKLWERICYKDNALVQGEIYHLWVIEKPDNLSLEELRNELPCHKADLNVIFTDSEAPYHRRKVTLLNGPHTVLAPVSFLAGVDIVRDACSHPEIGKFVRMVQFDELMPTLDLPEEELKQFANDVLERFENPYVDHQVTSIMLNSFPKYKTRDLPALKAYIARKGELPKGLVLGLAAIITYYKGGKREDGTRITPNDDPRILSLLQELWATNDTRKIAEGVLSARELIWQEEGDLTRIQGLSDLLIKYLDSIRDKGMLETVKSILPV